MQAGVIPQPAQQRPGTAARDGVQRPSVQLEADLAKEADAQRAPKLRRALLQKYYDATAVAAGP